MRVLLGVFSLVLIVACASKKRMAKPETCAETRLEVSTLNPLTEDQVNSWYKIKGDAFVEFKEEQFNMDVQIRMKMGELLWISISKASFPVAKLLFRKDSAFFIDLIHQEYLAEDYQVLQEKIGMSVNFENLQGIFLGQSLTFKDSVFQWVQGTTIVMSDRSKGDSAATMQLSNQEEVVRAQWVSCTSKQIEKQLYRLPHKQDELWVRFAKYELDQLINYPRLISIRALRKKQQKLLCNFEMKSVKSAQEMNIPFEIPANYAKME